MEYLGLRILFAAAVGGAGIVGAMTLFAPSAAAKYVFANATEVDTYLRLLGSLWLALGLVACLGLLRPVEFAPILLVQLLYKAAWLSVVAYPALIAGIREPALVLLTALFTVWVIALFAVVPFRNLLAGS